MYGLSAYIEAYIQPATPRVGVPSSVNHGECEQREERMQTDANLFGNDRGASRYTVCPTPHDKTPIRYIHAEVYCVLSPPRRLSGLSGRPARRHTHSTLAGVVRHARKKERE